MSISVALPYIQIILSVLLVGGILLQSSEAGLGGAFGGGDSFNSTQHERRGAEKTIFRLTLTLAILFVLSAFTALLLR